MNGQRRGPGRRTASLLLFLAVLVHNTEEALTYASTRSEATDLVQRVWPAAQLPGAEAFQVAALLLTAGVGALLAWAARTHRERPAGLAQEVVAAVLLANVFIPHLPAAILLGGYAPGVITALAFNLPLSVWILRKARQSSA